MKKTFILVLLFSVFYSLPCLAKSNDKAKHVACSAAFGLLADSITFYEAENLDATQRFLASTAIAVVPGVVKEALDDKFDMGDMTANIIGAASGSLLGETALGYASISASGSQFFVKFHQKF